jgi:hypothetical protein
MTDLEPDPLTQICRQIADQLRARPFWSNVEVLTPERGDIESTVEAAIQKLGLCAAIEITKGTVQFQAVGAVAMELPITITITEHVVLHRGDAWDGKTAMSALMDMLVAFNPVQTAQLMTVSGFELVNDTGGRLVFQVNGTARAGWTESAA